MTPSKMTKRTTPKWVDVRFTPDEAHSLLVLHFQLQRGSVASDIRRDINKAVAKIHVALKVVTPA